MVRGIESHSPIGERTSVPNERQARELAPLVKADPEEAAEESPRAITLILSGFRGNGLNQPISSLRILVSSGRIPPIPHRCLV